MNQFPTNSPFTLSLDGREKPEVQRISDIGRQRQEERNAYFAQKKMSAKEDVIHALRRIEMDLRRDNQHELADDLDAAINQVIGI